jgi:pimeloyl-ACP methyl ester carboxylesterase
VRPPLMPAISGRFPAIIIRGILVSLAVSAAFGVILCEMAVHPLRRVTRDNEGQAVGTGPWLGRTLLRPAVEAAFLTARLRYQIELADANPSRALRTTKTPVLLIHGLSDRDIPLRHAYAPAASNREHVALWLVPNATHTAAWAAAPDEYPAGILGFLAAHEGPPCRCLPIYGLAPEA